MKPLSTLSLLQLPSSSSHLRDTVSEVMVFPAIHPILSICTRTLPHLSSTRTITRRSSPSPARTTSSTYTWAARPPWLSTSLWVRGVAYTPHRLTMTVAINTLGSYGQTYDVNGLSIIQYPPLTAAVGVLTVNLTGSVAALNDVIGLNGRKRTVDFTPLPSNSILTSSSGISQFLVAVRGRGQVSAELGTGE